jgi:hypothetical protein
MLIIRSSIMTEFERNFYTLPQIGAILMAAFNTFTVTNTNDSGAGSLRQAITNADASTGTNVINFSGLFDDGLAHTISLTGGGLSITDDTTIQGTNPNLLTISEDSASRVFDVTSGATATINGLTITNSYNEDNNTSGTSTSSPYIVGGGGISNEGVLTLNNSIITGNTVGFNEVLGEQQFSEGGGIYNTGTLTVNHSIISDNSATTYTGVDSTHGFASGMIVFGYGSGIYNGGNLTLNDSNITGNSTAKTITYIDNNPYSGENDLLSYNGLGGVYNTGNLVVNHSTINGNNECGIANVGGNLTVNYSTISGNTGGYSTDSGNTGGVSGYNSGGGITNGSDSTLTVNYSIISGNTAPEGGGIQNSGSLTVNYSSIIDNTANNYNIDITISGEGGGIYNNNSATLTVSYSSISDNTAGTAGGGIYNDASSSTLFGIVTVSDSTISGNQAHFGGGIYNDGTLTVSNSAIYNNRAFGIQLSSGVYQSGDGGGIYNNSNYGTTTVYSNAIACNFDTCQEYSNNFISPDDIAGNFINNGYNWIGTTTSTTAAGDAV